MTWTVAEDQGVMIASDDKHELRVAQYGNGVVIRADDPHGHACVGLDRAAALSLLEKLRALLDA